MTNRLYVGNLAYSTTNEGLRAFFAAVGKVTHAEVVIERESGRSKGFGFVQMASDEDAQRAMALLNGKLLDQRPVRIDFARPKEVRTEAMSQRTAERSQPRPARVASFAPKRNRRPRPASRGERDRNRERERRRMRDRWQDDDEE
jgi:RNA recognition motif-containing protein